MHFEVATYKDLMKECSNNDLQYWYY